MKLTSFVNGGTFYSTVDAEDRSIYFFSRGRRLIAKVYLANKDLKAIRNLQEQTLKLLVQAWGRQKPYDNWTAHKNWNTQYDYYIEEENLVLFWKGHTCAYFKLFSQNAHMIEFVIETMIKLLEQYIKPRKTEK